MLACCGAPTAKKRTASARRAVPEGRPPPSVVGDDAPPASPLGDAAAPARPLSPDEEKAKRMLKYVKQQRNTGGSVDMMLTSAELETAADRTHCDSSSDAGSSDGWSGSDSGLGSTDSQNSQASNRSASTRQRRAARRLEKAMARAEDEAEKEQHLQRWDAPRALSLEIDRRVSAVRDIEPEVTRFLRATAKATDARMKALDTRLKSKASLTRKVLEKVSVIDNHQAAAEPIELISGTFHLSDTLLLLVLLLVLVLLLMVVVVLAVVVVVVITHRAPARARMRSLRWWRCKTISSVTRS